MSFLLLFSPLLIAVTLAAPGPSGPGSNGATWAPIQYGGANGWTSEKIAFRNRPEIEGRWDIPLYGPKYPWTSLSQKAPWTNDVIPKNDDPDDDDDNDDDQQPPALIQGPRKIHIIPVPVQVIPVWEKTGPILVPVYFKTQAVPVPTPVENIPIPVKPVAVHHPSEPGVVSVPVKAYPVPVPVEPKSVPVPVRAQAVPIPSESKPLQVPIAPYAVPLNKEAQTVPVEVRPYPVSVRTSPQAVHLPLKPYTVVRDYSGPGQSPDGS